MEAAAADRIQPRFLGRVLPRRTAGQWSSHYGSSATMRKVYVGKVTNYFSRIGVAEILVEAAPLEAGEEVFITGETTGVLEFTAEDIRVALKSAERVLRASIVP